jgi:hypothetical protein
LGGGGASGTDVLGGRIQGATKLILQKKKKIDFLRLQNFKFMRQITGNSIIMIFLRYIIPVRGGDCNYSPEEPKALAMPLFVLTISWFASYNF